MAVFNRNAKYLLRNKKSFSAVVMNAILIGLIMTSVFNGIGSATTLITYLNETPTSELDSEYVKKLIEKYINNLRGVSLNISN
jgi:pyruvate/2-oxoglutarate dehydrogenase complex dihydrolipoamide dehydrogenase (E3) component